MIWLLDFKGNLCDFSVFFGEAFPEVFAGACAALKKEIYETGGWTKI